MLVDIVGQLLTVHKALKKADLAHAFGGAIALAYCTEEPRGTRDVDVNIFAEAAHARQVLAALPKSIAVTDEDIAATQRDGQRRLWFDTTPVDVFLNNVPFHDEVARGVLWVPFAGAEIPVLNAYSLVVFKAIFSRAKDWVDIDGVSEVDIEAVRAALVKVGEMVGTDDERYRKLAAIVDDPGSYRRPGPNALGKDPGWEPKST